VEGFEHYPELTQEENKSALLEREQHYLGWLFSQPVYIYSIEGVFIQSFCSMTAAARWVGVSPATVYNNFRSGKNF
jgi:NUMOD1 domain